MRVPVEIRVLTKFERRGDDECWPWIAGKPIGYGTIWAGRNKRALLAHRLLYTMFRGEIPPGMTLDHLCHTNSESCPGGPTCPHRGCVNPWHLEVVTRAENTRRSPHNRAIRKTHCLRGHLITAGRDGRRRCRECDRMRSARSSTAGQRGEALPAVEPEPETLGGAW